MFPMWLIPLLISGVQYLHQQSAQNEIDQAEQAKVPGEQAQIQETMSQRGLGQSSAIGPYTQEPQRQFNVARRVATAQQLLAQPTVNPLVSAMQYYASNVGQQQGSYPQDYGRPQQPNPYYPRNPYSVV